MLVSTGWLSGQLEEPSVVILHVGSKADYDAGHIPGARLISLEDISVTGERGLRLELPPVDALREAFGRLGVSGNSNIVVYAGTDSVQSATRVWFTLDYLGLGGRTSLLDGGLAVWRAEGRPLQTEAPKFAPATFIPDPRPEIVVNASAVQARGAALLVDARASEFYTGANAAGMPRAGHIPGARNVPFHSLLDEQRRFKPAEALRELLGAPAGTAIAYCHIGQQATVAYFAARLLGLDARLYDGSFQDWSSRSELPVATGKDAGIQ